MMIMAVFTPIKCRVEGCNGKLEYTGKMTSRKSGEPRKHILKCTECKKEWED